MLWLLHGNLGHTIDWIRVQSILDEKGIASQALSLWDFIPIKTPQLTQDTPSLYPSHEKAITPLQRSGQLIAEHIGNKDTAPILCGYSLGGRLALHAYQAIPHIWQQLILISTSWGLPEDAISLRQERALIDNQWANLLHDTSWEDLYTQWRAQPLFSGDANYDKPEPSPHDKEAMIVAFRQWSLSTQHDLSNEILPLTTPLHLITGELDSKFHHQTETLLPHLLQNTTHPIYHSVIPQGGHRLLETTPRVLTEAILNHLPKKNTFSSFLD